MERLSDGLGSALLIKGKYALGQYCTVQKERGSLGYKPKVPAKRKLKRTLWYLSTKRDVPNVSAYCENWWDLSCFFFGLLNADWGVRLETRLHRAGELGKHPPPMQLVIHRVDEVRV